jgi:hypothetical protein
VRAQPTQPPDRSAIGRRTRGQVLVLFVLSITALFSAAGLAIDIGRFYTERRTLQNAADAAALAAASSLTRGMTTSQARAEALTVLSRNFVNAPNGAVMYLPPASGSEVYASGHAGDPSYLIEGILFGTADVRVAIHSHVPYTFGRIVGLSENVVYAAAKAEYKGDLLPIAARNFTHAPGPGTGSYPCVSDTRQFTDFFSTADTSCLGTDADASLRSEPNAGAAFDSSNPGSDPGNHGPIVEILGTGAEPDNGADFRGYVALDIRNFANTTSQLYYNNVTPSTGQNTLKDLEAAWIWSGGYPGPMFAPVVSPPDPNLQIAILNGNSAGTGIDAFDDRFGPGDAILVCVYSGLTNQIPDFSMSSPPTIALPTTGATASLGSFRVSRNQAFSGVVAMTTVADSGDLNNPMVTGTLLGGASPITYTPNPVTPSQGSGTTVTMTNATTLAAPTGVYTLWLRGEAGSPYLTIKYLPFAVQVGSVNRDFAITASASEAVAAAMGDTVAYTLNLKRIGSSFGNNVTLSLEALPGSSLPTGLGSVSFSPSSVNPSAGSGTDVTLTINTGSVAPGQYHLVVRATGVNGDPTPRAVTHLLPLKLSVATGTTSASTEYIDVSGWAVMRVASITSNTVYAYAITPVVSDLDDPRLRRGQVARLVPWD